MQTISEKSNPNMSTRKSFGLKAESTLHRIILNPSSANPGETLYLYIPKLSENKVIVPRSVSLRFDLILEGHANNTVVNNVAQNLVSQFKVKFASETLQNTTRYDLIKTYEDLFTDRDNKLRQGISSEKIRKLRTNAGAKDDSNTKEVTLASIHNTKYCFPIGHPILDDHGVFHPWALSDQLCFEITFAPVNNVLIYSDTTKPPNYKITNLELEYICISSEFLANEAAGGYQIGCGFLYENIVLHKTFNIAKATDAIINEHVNIPRRSMTGILCLFTEVFTAGTRNSENVVNPKSTSVNFNIDGVPNKLFLNGMLPSDFWQSLNNRFNTKDTLKESDFYAGKFALWIDLRSQPDNDIHGGGLFLNNTRDGVKTKIKRQTSGSGNITCHMFVVADAIMEIMKSNLQNIKY